MLSRLRLLYHSSAILNALNECTTGLALQNCWVSGKYKTVHISAQFQNKKFHAWGCDSNESIAYAKALMELTERLHLSVTPKNWTRADDGQNISHTQLLQDEPVLASFLKTSSGMAAHFNIKRVRENSVHEIIERHVLGKVFLESTSPSRSMPDTFLWNGPLKRTVCLKRYKVPRHGYIYSSAAHLQAHAAIEAASRELSALIAWSQNAVNIEALLSQITQDSPSETQRHHLSRAQSFDFLQTSRPGVISCQIQSKDMWHAEIDKIEPFKKVKDLIINRSFCPLMQPLFFGKVEPRKINPKAINPSLINQEAAYHVVA